MVYTLQIGNQQKESYGNLLLFFSTQERSGELSNKPCLLHCTVCFNHIAIFCHMTHYITVSVTITISKTMTKCQDIFPATAGAIKHINYTSAYFTTGISRMHYSKSGFKSSSYLHSQWDMACIHSSTDVSFSVEMAGSGL